MGHQNIRQLLDEATQPHATKAAYRYKQDGSWAEVTWEECRARVDRVSRALIAQGVGHGDRVGILSDTRLEWVLCDFGCVSCGAVTVGIYPSSLDSECAYVIDHSDAAIVFVENAAQRDKILSTRSQLPDLRRIVIFDGPTDEAHSVLSWEDFLASGEKVPDSELQARKQGVRPDDLASLVYTSGTTGVPKGVMISHGNLLFVSDSATRCIDLDPRYETLLFLPLAHVFARLVIYFCMRTSIAVAFAEGIPKVAANIQETRPHFIASAPRIYEKVYDRIISGAAAAGGLKKKLFDWAVGVGMQVNRLRGQKKPVPFGLRLKRALAHKLVFRKIHAALGGRLVFAISGAAPLNQSIAEFFDACGVPVLEGIGMTENTSFSHVNRIDNNRCGTVGQPGPEIEARIAEDGEVLIRGKNVMQGYFKNPEATAETIDKEGWLYTGDIGEIDDDGFLRITDRKKDLIVTAGGKNVAPQKVERILRTSHYIAQVMAYGDRRKYLTAAVTLEPEAIAEWARQNGVSGSPEALASDRKLNALIGEEIAERNKQLASFETVKRFFILPEDFTIENGELTPSGKIKRKVVTERYLERFERLYHDSRA